MSLWAGALALVAAIIAGLVSFGPGPQAVLSGMTELAAVVALFALVCAAEALN